MKPDVVADIGNSRIKWGFCTPEGVARMVSLPPNDPGAWEKALDQSTSRGKHSWLLAGVNPQEQSRFTDWLRHRGDTVRELTSWLDLRLTVSVESPESVGLDRLLNAVAAKDRVKRGVSIFIVDAGSAVTVDWVDEKGTFRGGAIFPGCRLMAKALNDYTAFLPLVDIDWTNPPLPGNSSTAAIKAGVYWAVAGGIRAVLRQLAARSRCAEPQQLIQSRVADSVVFLTGGDARLLAPVMDSSVIVWPHMTLEGIRIAAEGLP